MTDMAKMLRDVVKEATGMTDAELDALIDEEIEALPDTAVDEAVNDAEEGELSGGPLVED